MTDILLQNVAIGLAHDDAIPYPATDNDDDSQSCLVRVVTSKGVNYVPMNSAQAALVAIKVAESPRHQYALDKIIGEKSVGDDMYYLAKWAGTDKVSYELAATFEDSAIEEWYEEKARMQDIDKYYDGTFPKSRAKARPKRGASDFVSHDYSDLQKHRAATAKLLEDVSGPIPEGVMDAAMEWDSIEELMESEAHKYM